MLKNFAGYKKCIFYFIAYEDVIIPRIQNQIETMRISKKKEFYAGMSLPFDKIVRQAGFVISEKFCDMEIFLFISGASHSRNWTNTKLLFLCKVFLDTFSDIVVQK